MLHSAELLASNAPVVLAGDYNVIPTELDVYAPERWVDDALFRPEVREAFRRLVAQGWVDAVRAMHPSERVYTFWKYLRNAFERDAGLRIDHFLLSPSLATRLTGAGVDRDVRARERASDHAPVWITLDRCPADGNVQPWQATNVRVGARTVRCAPASPRRSGRRSSRSPVRTRCPVKALSASRMLRRP